MGSPSSLYPSVTLLSSWCDRDWERAQGVQLETLDSMQRLLVRTHQHTYEMFVTRPLEGTMLIRGGRFFQKFTEARLIGSSLGSSFLKQRGIYVGMRMEIGLEEGETILTAPVFGLSVCSANLRDADARPC